jgi:hypothetical protein
LKQKPTSKLIIAGAKSAIRIKPKARRNHEPKKATDNEPAGKKLENAKLLSRGLNENHLFKQKPF